MIKELGNIVAGGRAMSQDSPNRGGVWCSVRTMMAAVLGCAALTATSGIAQAQYVEPAARKPFALRVGTYIPTEQDARRAGGTHNFAVEIDYAAQLLPEQSSVSVISLGFIEREGLRIVPFTVGQIFRDPGSARPYYYGLGIGLYTIRLELPDVDNRVKSLLGGYAVVGLDLSDSFFVEGKYHYIDHFDRKFVGGTHLSVGVRF